MEISPASIVRVDDSKILIEWSDGAQLEYVASQLRAHCPCATCREKGSADAKPEKSRTLPVLSLAEARPLRIEHMRPVGNYAYSIGFSDGHDSGIFTFDLLRELGQPH